MSNKNLQIVNDEIVCYKQSLSEIDDKLNLLKFLDSIDSSIAETLHFDGQELLKERKSIEKKLRELLEEKLKLTGNEEEKISLEQICISGNSLNSLRISNYMALLHNLNDGADINVKKFL